MTARKLAILTLCLLLIVPAIVPMVVASQATRLTPGKAITSDISGDGNFTHNVTTNGRAQVNGSLSFGHWASTLVGNITNVTITGTNKTWTFPDETGMVLLAPQPDFTDYTRANHDHADADDGGTLDAAAIASGEFSRSRLAAQICYEDEACSMAVRTAFLDGFTATANAYTNKLRANGSIDALAWLFGASATQWRQNGTLSVGGKTWIEDTLQVNSTGNLTVKDSFINVGDGGAVSFFSGGSATPGSGIQIRRAGIPSLKLYDDVAMKRLEIYVDQFYATVFNSENTGLDMVFNTSGVETVRYDVNGKNIWWTSGSGAGLYGKLDHANTASRTYTFPDATGTVPVLTSGTTTTRIPTSGVAVTPSTTRSTHVTMQGSWAASTAGQASDLAVTCDGQASLALNVQNPLAAGTWNQDVTWSCYLPPGASYTMTTGAAQGTWTLRAIETPT